jgi:hypothetical protein
MATTYRAVTSLSASGTADLSAEQHTSSGTAAGDSDIVDNTQIIGTSSEAITVGEIAAGSAEFIEISNLDATNFISIGFENPAVAGTKTFRIKAGHSALFPRPSGALYAIADTANVTVLVKAVEV